MITLRLDQQLEQEIQNAASMLGVTKSEFIRKSITAYLAAQNAPTPWDIGESLFGRHASGKDNLSTDRKALIKAKIQAGRK